MATERHARNQIRLYPLRFEPIYQYRLWGDRRLGNLLSAPLPGDGPTIPQPSTLNDKSPEVVHARIPAIPSMPSLARAILTPCTRGAPRKLKGCSSYRLLCSPGSAGVLPLYMALSDGEEGQGGAG